VSSKLLVVSGRVGSQQVADGLFEMMPPHLKGGVMKKISVLMVGIVCLLFCFTVTANSAEPTGQYLAAIDKVLAANPPKPGEIVQRIPLTGDDTATILVLRVAKDGVAPPHFHKTHTETVYIVKGSGQLLIDGKWVPIEAGSLFLNSATNAHGVKNTGPGEMIAIAIYTPALKEPDSIPVP